ncbi:hypothetical protein GCM10009565_16660 [Amycolatopsis albidoflavus]
MRFAASLADGLGRRSRGGWMRNVARLGRGGKAWVNGADACVDRPGGQAVSDVDLRMRPATGAWQPGWFRSEAGRAGELGGQTRWPAGWVG